MERRHVKKDYWGSVSLPRTRRVRQAISGVPRSSHLIAAAWTKFETLLAEEPSS